MILSAGTDYYAYVLNPRRRSVRSSTFGKLALKRLLPLNKTVTVPPKFRSRYEIIVSCQFSFFLSVFSLSLDCLDLLFKFKILKLGYGDHFINNTPFVLSNAVTSKDLCHSAESYAGSKEYRGRSRRIDETSLASSRSYEMVTRHQFDGMNVETL